MASIRPGGHGEAETSAPLRSPSDTCRPGGGAGCQQWSGRGRRRWTHRGGGRRRRFGHSSHPPLQRPHLGAPRLTDRRAGTVLFGETVGVHRRQVLPRDGEIGTDFYFDLGLPRSTYQGQYVQEGCGGFCGLVEQRVPLAADDCPAVTGNTLAVAVDNEGHVTSSVTDASWASDNSKSRTVFGSTSEHQLAVVAKALITGYYGRRPTYSYFDGCSDGGREALIEAQRYPHDFNGILAGAPANIQSELLGELATWNIRVNTGPGGRAILTSQKLPALHAAVVRACGQGRGYVLDPRTCNFPPSSIECHGRTTSSCLTAAQVRVVTSLYRAPATRPDSPSTRAASPTVRSWGGRTGSSSHRAIGTGPRTR